MVSAWATANQISLGQVVVDAKSNEIMAIPQLLKILEIAGCLVTIDAMGCQVDIARDIVAAGADYACALRGDGMGQFHSSGEAHYLNNVKAGASRFHAARCLHLA